MSRSMFFGLKNSTFQDNEGNNVIISFYLKHHILLAIYLKGNRAPTTNDSVRNNRVDFQKQYPSIQFFFHNKYPCEAYLDNISLEKKPNLSFSIPKPIIFYEESSFELQYVL